MGWTHTARRHAGRTQAHRTLHLAVAAAFALPVAMGATATIGVPAQAATAVAADVAMKVLVLDDGMPMVAAIADRLTKEGVPFTRVDLTSSTRAAITSAYLVKSDTAGAHGQFMGIVTPNEAPAQLTEAERKILHEYEAAFKVREVNAYTWAHPEVGLNYAGFTGAVDGMTATITAAGKADAFSYLTGAVTLDDVSGSVVESYGYLGTPIAATATESFTPLVTATIPGTSEQGSLVGVYAKEGREQLVVTFAENANQTHFRTIAHGVVNWLTRGVSLSMNRNYLSVHVDDVLLGDARWSATNNCTVGDDCPTTVTEPDVRMTAADVTKLVNWQKTYGIKLDVAFNGFGESDNAVNGTDALTKALLANKSSLRWINHTWSHPYLGCVQNFTTSPWTCTKKSNGAISYATLSTIYTEIGKNSLWGLLKGLPGFNTAELITGEHSGLKTAPQMAVDNPNLATALTLNGVKWVASDASRETESRKIGSATTVPRHPMNIYYNTGTKAEAADEYNYIYTSAANGGSGICETNPAVMTCIDPLDTATGFDSYIVPLEARIATSHVLDNDAMPHYAHQSNLAEDGVLYPVLSKMITDYKATFASNTPLVNPTMSEAGQQLVNQQTWKTAQASITGVISGTKVTLKNGSTSAITTPVTVPTGTVNGKTAIGSAYAGANSAWTSIAAKGTLSLTLPAATGFAGTVTWEGAAGAADAPAGTPDTAVAGNKTATTRVRLPEAISKLLAGILG